MSSVRKAATGLRLRDATDADMADVAAVYAHHVTTSRASFELTAPDAAEMVRRRADVVKRGLPWLLAELDGKVAGFAYASSYRPRPAYRYTVEDSVYVAPWAMRRGAGSALLTELIARCEALGYRAMVAVIGGSDNVGSIALHAASGFRHAGMLPAVGWKLGQWADSVIMTRPLGEGAQTPPQG